MVQKGVPIDRISDEEALDRVRMVSVLWPAPLVPLDLIEHLRKQAVLRAVKEALTELGDVELVVRDLAANDLGLNNRRWNEQTSGAVDAWENSLIAGSNVPDQTWVAITGLVDLGTQGSVSAIRIESGGTRVSEWDLHKQFNPNAARASYVDLSRYGIALAPVHLRQNTEVTVSYYTRGASNTNALPAEIPFLGVTVETVGGGHGLHPQA